MATIRRYEEIEAWKEGRELVKKIYELTRVGDFSRDYGLRDQIQRASVSVCSNIAEGFERSGNREFANFLWIAKGSAGEVSSQLYNAKDLGYISESQFEQLYMQTESIRGKLNNFIKALKSSSYTGQRNRYP